MSDASSKVPQTAIVTGASRGLGRGVAEALATRGMHVLAVARDRGRLEALARESAHVKAVVADAADEIEVARLFESSNPDLVVVCAGAAPLLRPFHLQSWRSFSVNWEVDTKSAFLWLREAFLARERRARHVIIVSSAAALHGSPLSGGYAGAKRMQWFLSEYAAAAAQRSGIALRVHCLLPTLNPSTELGRAAIAAYAAMMGQSREEFEKRLQPSLTPAIMGGAVAALFEHPERYPELAYQIGGTGLVRLSELPQRAAAAPAPAAGDKP